VEIVADEGFEPEPEPELLSELESDFLEPELPFELELLDGLGLLELELLDELGFVELELLDELGFVELELLDELGFVELGSLDELGYVELGSLDELGFVELEMLDEFISTLITGFPQNNSSSYSSVTVTFASTKL